MTTAGYSGKPLAAKLGIKGGHTVAVLDAPAGFRSLLEPLDAGVRLRTSIGRSPDLVIVFATAATNLHDRLLEAADSVFPDRAIWAAWPKRSSKVPTDITEDTVRALALPLGLVDTKVCAIDGVWSGLRLVWRKERRTRA